MKVLLGMSGGVDSSAAAILLQDQGYEVIGASIQFYSSTDSAFFNSNLDKNIEHATLISKLIGIEHIVIDAQLEFKDIVLNYFTSEYLKARTPFPCVICNREVKWPILFKKMKELGCDYISTGHYVNVMDNNGKYYIVQGKDDDKDQSFFLWPLGQDILKRAVFPLANCKKTEVKKLVGNYITDISEKKESTGICFLKSSDYRPFLKSFIKENSIQIEKGKFFNENADFLGEHEGYPFYTIGQRRGLNLKENKKPLFVKQIETNNNSIILTNKKSLNKTVLWVKDYQIVDKNDFNAKVKVKIRYRKQENLGMVEFVDEKTLKVKLIEPVDSVAPGQTAVFYEGSKLLGGGFIDRSE